MISALDKSSLVGMALGVALMLQPWWEGGFHLGFFMTLNCTVLQIVAAHLPARPSASKRRGFEPLLK